MVAAEVVEAVAAEVAAAAAEAVPVAAVREAAKVGVKAAATVEVGAAAPAAWAAAPTGAPRPIRPASRCGPAAACLERAALRVTLPAGANRMPGA